MSSAVKLFKDAVNMPPLTHLLSYYADSDAAINKIFPKIFIVVGQDFTNEVFKEIYCRSIAVNRNKTR